MDGLMAQIEQCADQTKVCVRLVNHSSQAVHLVAPDPYLEVWLFDQARLPYPRVRSVRYDHSLKLFTIKPCEGCLMTLDLLPYWDDVCGEVFVRISLEVIRDSEERCEYTVEGRVRLSIPSYDEKFRTMKSQRRASKLPTKVFDVSDSTQFSEAWIAT